MVCREGKISLKPFQKGMISIYLICGSHYIYVLYQQCSPPPNQGSIVCDAGQIYFKRQGVLMKVWNQKKKKSPVKLYDFH